MKYQLVILALLVFLAPFEGMQAQTTLGDKPVYKISGKILDGETGEPIPYAAAALLDAESLQNTTGAVADLDGEFVITGFKNGKYILQLSNLGFETMKTQVIDITPGNTNVDLGEIKLKGEAIGLQEVTVQGQRALIEEKVDRTIYNAENDKTTIGGDGHFTDIFSGTA